MPDNTQANKTTASETAPGAAVPPVRRHPGHRGADVRDTVAEMAAKAQEISMEAGSKMAAAMKDVISAAAGLTSFAVESSRDLVQYMVRRGQMTQEEADKLIREAEESWSRKHKGKKPPARVHLLPGSKVEVTPQARPLVAPHAARAHAPATASRAKPAAKKPTARKKAKSAKRPVAKKKKPVAKKRPAAKKKPAAKKRPAAKKKPAAKKRLASRKAASKKKPAAKK